jgi:hypothetical protein
VVAADLMKQGPGAIDWSGWLISVDDRRGNVIVNISFTAGTA